MIQRNSHASLIDGLVLSGGLRGFVMPEYDAELGMAHGVTPERSSTALARAPRRGGVHRLAHLLRDGSRCRGCAEVAHRAGVPLSSTAPGDRTSAFTRRCRASPLRLGADAMLASTHKIVGSLTQSAMLLVGTGARSTSKRSRRAVRLVRSTSPSSLLMVSLDAARRQLAVHGEALLDSTIEAAGVATAAIDAVPGCSTLGEAMVGRPECHQGPAADRDRRARDRLHRLRVAAALRASYAIYVELATHATLVLVLGLGQPVDALLRLAHDFAETVRRIARPGRPCRLTARCQSSATKP